MFSKLTVIIAVASVMASSVIAAPSYPVAAAAPPPATAGPSCGNKQIQSCCNTANPGGFLDILNSLDCLPIVDLVPFGGVCKASQTSACCPAGHNNQMLLNVQCNQLAI